MRKRLEQKNKKYIEDKLEVNVKSFKVGYVGLSGNPNDYFKVIDGNNIKVIDYILTQDYTEEQLDIIINLIEKTRVFKIKKLKKILNDNDNDNNTK